MQELCASKQLVHMDEVSDVLAHILSSAQLQDGYVEELLAMMASLYPSEHHLLRARVSALRPPGQPQPDELCAPLTTITTHPKRAVPHVPATGEPGCCAQDQVAVSDIHKS